MATVKFTYALKRFFPDLKEEETITAATVKELLAQLETNYPGLTSYVVDERGQLRKHVNIYVNNAHIKDEKALSDPLTDQCEVYIMQALSGG